MKRKNATERFLATLLMAALVLSGAKTFAQEPGKPRFERDIQFARELNAIGLFDYADKHIGNLIKQHPAETLLKAQLVDNMLAQNKTAEASEIIKSLPPETVAYYEAVASIGTYAVLHNNFEEGYKQLSRVLQFALKTNEIQRFKNPLVWLLTTCQKLGRLEEAQNILAAIQNAESTGKASKRDLLYSRAEFTLASIETLRTKQKERYELLLSKLRDQVWNITANADILQRVEKLFGSDRDRLYIPPVEDLAKILNASLSAQTEKKFSGERPEPSGKPSENPGKIATLKQYLNNAEKENAAYYSEIKKGMNPADKKINANRLKAYVEIGNLLGIPAAEMTEIAEMAAFRDLREFRRLLMLKKITKLSDQERKILSFNNKKDWQDAVYLCLKDLEEVQWGGLDMRSAFAIAQVLCCRYYLGDREPALHYISKFRDLYKNCDDAYRGDKEFGLEASPSANAKMWEGRIALSLALQQEKSGKSADRKEALRNYKRAFVCYGLLLKNYSKHKDGPKNYPVFLKICEKLTALDPKLASLVAKESAKVPKPEKEEKEGELEDLVSPLTEQEFKNGYAQANANTKKLRSKTPPSAADWKVCEEHFAKVIKDLLPAMDGKYKSNGMPKLLNHLLIASAYQEDPFSIFITRTLSDLGQFKFRSDPLVAHGALMSGNALWSRADRMKKAAAQTSKTDEKQKLKINEQFLKDQAIAVYDDFLKIDRAHKNAPFICARIAREEFIRANAAGLRYNQEKDPDTKAKLHNEWISGFDRSIQRYQFILDNFRNLQSLVDEAYERSAEAYNITERFMDAVAVNKRFCAAGSSNRPRIVNAKMEIATNLYRNASVYEKEAKEKQESAAAIVIPEPVKPEKKVVLDPAAQQSAQPAVNTSQETPEQQAAGEAKAKAEYQAAMAKAEAEYQAALTQYEEDIKRAKLMTEKKALLNKEADALSLQAKTCYKEAIEHVLEFTKKWIAPKGKYADLLKDTVVKQNIMRAASLLPWLYDGAGEQENAVKSFQAYIASYPKEKAVPQYMMRLSILFTDMGRDEDARKVLDRLSSEYKDTPEGKNAKFALARNLYSRGNYKRAIAELKEIFTNPDLRKNLTVSNYRWLSSTLANCMSPEFRKQAADFAFQASKELLNRLAQNPRKYTDWVSDINAIEFRADRAKADEFFKMIQEKLLLDTASAASAMGDDKEAVAYYDKLKKFNKDTPYFYQMTFGRANANVRLKNYEAARKDLVEAGSRANYTKQTALYNKAQVMIGEIWEMQDDPKRAFASYWIIAGLLPEKRQEEKSTSMNPAPAQPGEDTTDYLEKAIYKAAEAAKKIGRTTDMNEMIKRYRNYYPDGHFKTEINALEK